MSVVNAEGIWKFSAGAVAANQIEIAYSLTESFTADDTTFGPNTYVDNWTQTLAITGTATATRQTPFAALADDKFAMTTGTVSVGDGSSVPPFFRALLAEMTCGSTTLNTLRFSVSASLNVIHTYVDRGGGNPTPPNTNDTYTGTLLITLYGARTGTTLDWTYAVDKQGDVDTYSVNLVSNYDHSESFTIDPINWKKSGSDDFGFVWNATTSDPGSVPGFADMITSSWTAHNNVTVAAS